MPDNYLFDMAQWLPRFPLAPEYEHFHAEQVTSPGHLCRNEQLRNELADQMDLGEGVAVDVFVMALGDPSDRHVTKIGGLPFRPSGRPWPCDPQGLPLTFLGQFCFADSHDLVGELPEEVLLVFASECEEIVYFEWWPLGLEALCTAAELPPTEREFAPCYGHRHRAVSYPSARRKARRKKERYLKAQGIDVRSDYWLWQFQATQIGGAPFFIQRKPKLTGRVICALNSVSPDVFGPYPWVNHPAPLSRRDDWDGMRQISGQHLMFADLGCLYIAIDDQQETSFAVQSF